MENFQLFSDDVSINSIKERIDITSACHGTHLCINLVKHDVVRK